MPSTFFHFKIGLSFLYKGKAQCYVGLNKDWNYLNLEEEKALKKIIFAIILFSMAAALSACSGKEEVPKLLNKEGIAPYELSQSEHYVLEMFGMDKSSHMISFNAPNEAITLKITVYYLEGEAWTEVGGGAVSLGEDREISRRLQGTMAMELRENHVMDFTVDTMGRAAFTSKEIQPVGEESAQAVGFLQDFKEIELNKEIPIALMVYDDGTSMKELSLDYYFEPSMFEGMNLVQAVTVTFSDEAF